MKTNKIINCEANDLDFLYLIGYIEAILEMASLELKLKDKFLLLNQLNICFEKIIKERGSDWTYINCNKYFKGELKEDFLICYIKLIEIGKENTQKFEDRLWEIKKQFKKLVKRINSRKLTNFDMESWRIKNKRFMI